MYIEKIREVSDELIEAINRLVPQLGTHKVIPTRKELTTLVSSEASTLWIARYPDENSSIMGMLAIAVYQVPTGIRSIIEDVVVDQEFRRQGIAEALLKEAIEHARNLGVAGIALTSNPKREAANKLYQSMGFEKRETNAYYFKIN
jgi:ribosomal protein S18 acetylase RimI-like enzyme